MNIPGVFLGEDLDIEEHEDAAAPKINLNEKRSAPDTGVCSDASLVVKVAAMRHSR